MQPTKQQWDEVKSRLSSPFGSVYLRCDGYLICAQVIQEKMKLQIAVYVNGYIKGTDIWGGKETTVGDMPEISKRFYFLKKRLVPVKQQAINIKIWGKKDCKDKGFNDAFLQTIPWFNNPGTFIAHIKNHNESIEILDYPAYQAARDAQAEETADATE